MNFGNIATGGIVRGTFGFLRTLRNRAWTKTRDIAARLSPPEDISHWRNLTVLLFVTLTICLYNWLVVIKDVFGGKATFTTSSVGLAVMVLALWTSIPAGAALKRYCKRQTLPHLVWVFTALCAISIIQVVFLPGILDEPKASIELRTLGSLIGAVQLAVTSWMVKVPWDRATEAVTSANEIQLGKKWDDPIV